jgi:nucleotide-binding universal stress UspA family protein
MLIGSVAEQVLRSVYLPVITVGPEAHLPVDMDPGRVSDRVVLHATTLRETSRPSAALACQIAASQKARLVLLHVLPHLPEMEGKGLPTGMDSSAMVELRILAEQIGAGAPADQQLQEPGSVGWGAGCASAVEPVVAYGNPSIEILALAQERQASLIVLGATRRAAFENLTRDRTIYRVLAHARCPVLTLRETQIMPEEVHAETSAAHH